MDYNELEKAITHFKKLKSEIIGRSEDDRNIYSLSAFFGENRPWVIMHGAIHAREHLSTDFVIMMANFLEVKFEQYKKNKDFPNICLVPMVNPDGVQIVHRGLIAIKSKKLRENLKNIINNENYIMIKCNARGVDLNNNFDANWGKHINSQIPSSIGYIGGCVFSEKESRALARITLKLNPIFTISYHLKGEEIYFDFFQKGRERNKHKEIAKKISKVNGYKIKSTEKISSGGYKDWCVSKLKIPAITIELGRDELEHPIQSSEVYNIIAKNSGILDSLCDIVKLVKGENTYAKQSSRVYGGRYKVGKKS